MDNIGRNTSGFKDLRVTLRTTPTAIRKHLLESVFALHCPHVGAMLKACCAFLSLVQTPFRHGSARFRLVQTQLFSFISASLAIAGPRKSEAVSETNLEPIWNQSDTVSETNLNHSQADWNHSQTSLTAVWNPSETVSKTRLKPNVNRV